ncbi:MAG TPA: heavy metal-binding domain-containing protein [Dehalococcoidia bacterium]
MAEPNDAVQPEDPASSQRSAQELAAGQLPLAARGRLQQEAGRRRFFATDLSVAELLLAEAEGYEALGLVMGSSVYHVGWQTYGWNWYAGAQELETVTQAHMHARELAMGRMEQEAAALGAHGVVGVRLTAEGYEGEGGLLDFKAIGTAVRLRGAPPPPWPFISDLSGDDFWTLLQAGYLPLGLAMGFCAYYNFPFRYPYVAGTLWRYGNMELPEWTRTLYEARHLAMQRLAADVQRAGAQGVAGVRIDVQKHLHERKRGSRHYLGLVVEFFTMGTAIAQARPAFAAGRPQPMLDMIGLARRSATQAQELQTR